MQAQIFADSQVSFAAEGPGAFSLVARSLNTAKLDANAILTVNAAVTNWVTALQLTCSCLAASAGDCLQLLVAATTEDDQVGPVPCTAVQESYSLSAFHSWPGSNSKSLAFLDVAMKTACLHPPSCC